MEKEISLPSLEPMIGRVVRVYKGGPESRVGRLLAVNDDHLVMHNENDGVLYYYLRHIKSIAEDTKEIAEANENNEEVEFRHHHEMEDVLNDMIGKNIRIDRGGPESRNGRLLAVTYDHLALETNEDGVLYVRLHHVKSVNEEQAKQENGEEKGNEQPEAEERTREFIDEDGFDELLDALKYRWIKINRGGPESIEGVLVDSSGDHLVLVVNQEVSRIPTWHIRNISVATKKVEEQKEEENNSEENNKNNNNESKLSSDDISYIEKMLSEKYKSRSRSSSDRGSDRGSERRSGRGSNRKSGRRSSGNRSDRGSNRRSDRRSNRRSERRSDRRSNRRSDRRSNRREKRRSSNRRENRSGNKNRKRKSKRSGSRLTFFTR